MYTSLAVQIIVAAAVLPFVAFISICLRLKARRLTSQSLKADDYLVLATLICSIALTIIAINACIHGSLGKDLTTITPHEYSTFNKHIYALVIPAYLSFGIIKMSVIQLYKRIFSTPKFLKLANTLLCIIALWTTITLFLAIFSAWPISNFWNLGSNYAFDHPKFLFASTILDTSFDLFILCLPFPKIWQLQTVDVKHKCKLLGMFSMGFFCVVAAGLRIYYGYRLSNTSVNTESQISRDSFTEIVVNNVIWVLWESNMSIVAACLPCFGPFLKHLSFELPSLPRLSLTALLTKLSWTSSHRSTHPRSTSRQVDQPDQTSPQIGQEHLHMSRIGSERNLIVVEKTDRTPSMNMLDNTEIRVTKEYIVDVEDL